MEIVSDEDIQPLSQMGIDFIELDEYSSSLPFSCFNNPYVDSSSSSFSCIFNNPPYDSSSSYFSCFNNRSEDSSPSSFFCFNNPSGDSSPSSFSCFNNPSDYQTLQVEFCDQNPTTFLSLQEILESVTDSEAEILGKILFYWREMMNMRPEKLRKMIVSRLRMDGYEASLCKTSWLSTFGRPSAFRFRGCYEYIDVMMKSESNGGESLRLIVDTYFRSQFELARPTQAYKELSNSLPSIFVGTEEKLHSIISLLCTATKQSLKENGLHVPPWRKAAYMHSKWLSENCKKFSFSPLCT